VEEEIGSKQEGNDVYKMRGLTLRLEVNSERPEEDHGGRNRAEDPPGLRKKRGGRQRFTRSRSDSFRGEAQGDVAVLLVRSDGEGGCPERRCHVVAVGKPPVVLEKKEEKGDGSGAREEEGRGW
jgi:hypothetical protein